MHGLCQRAVSIVSAAVIDTRCLVGFGAFVKDAKEPHRVFIEGYLTGF